MCIRDSTYSIFKTKLYGDTEIDALVLDGARLRAPTVRLLEAQEVLQVPRPIKGRPPGKEGGKMAQAPTGQHREADREIREETRGGAKPKKLPGSRWGDTQRALILERCNSELRQLEDYMASEHLALPGSSNVVALAYRGPEPDVQRARLVREKQSRETVDRMECCQSRDVDASAWADDHRTKIRGHDGAVPRRGATAEHPLIEEVRQAARKQKGQAVSDWLKETEPEQEQEPEPTQSKGRRNRRGDNENIGAGGNQ